MRGISLMPSTAQAEHGFALALGVGMQRVRLDLGPVLQQPVQDMDGFPDAARDEAGEERDVAVSDVVVGDAAIGAVADVLGAQEIVLAQLHVRAVGDGGAAAAPVPRQGKAGVLVDDVDQRRLQLVGVDVLRVDPAQRLRRRNLGGVPGGLPWTEIAAVSEHGEQVALDGLRELRIGAGRRPEVTGVTRPVLGVLEDVEEVALRHACADLLLELGQPDWLLRRRQLLQVRRPVGIDAELGVGWKAGVDSGGERRQLSFQRGSKILALFRNPESGAVGRQACFALRPGQELGAVVCKGLGADDVEISSLQGIGQINEYADLDERLERLLVPRAAVPNFWLRRVFYLFRLGIYGNASPGSQTTGPLSNQRPSRLPKIHQVEPEVCSLLCPGSGPCQHPSAA
jgi:hypothetical protein